MLSSAEEVTEFLTWLIIIMQTIGESFSNQLLLALMPKKLFPSLANLLVPQPLSKAIWAKITEDGIPYLRCWLMASGAYRFKKSAGLNLSFCPGLKLLLLFVGCPLQKSEAGRDSLFSPGGGM